MFLIDIHHPEAPCPRTEKQKKAKINDRKTNINKHLHEEKYTMRSL
jgi:hypothetical protein